MPSSRVITVAVAFEVQRMPAFEVDYCVGISISYFSKLHQKRNAGIYTLACA